MLHRPAVLTAQAAFAFRQPRLVEFGSPHGDLQLAVAERHQRLDVVRSSIGGEAHQLAALVPVSRLTPKERAELEGRLRAGTTEQRQLLRIRIVLEAAEGHATREIARWLETTPTTVSLWRGRFARERLAGLEELPRSGAPPIYGEETDNASGRCSISRLRRVLRAGTAV
jgi:Helix-turn-helix domain